MNDGMNDGSNMSAVQHKRNSISPSVQSVESSPLKTPSSFHERPVANSYFSPVSQQSAQSYQYGSVYGSNTSATAGGSYQLGANAGYNTVPYGSSGSQGSGCAVDASGEQGMQNPQYSSGYGGQQAYNPNYPAYSTGSTSTTTGADAYTGLATAQAAMAQASASMANGHSGGQSPYYSSGVPSSAPPSYGGSQSSPSLYPPQSTASNYSYGAGYPSSVRSATGSVEGYAPYPASNSATDIYQSPYASTYPTSHDGVSSTSTALGAFAGMPVPLGSTAPVNSATGTTAEGEQEPCLVM